MNCVESNKDLDALKYFSKIESFSDTKERIEEIVDRNVFEKEKVSIYDAMDYLIYSKDNKELYDLCKKISFVEGKEYNETGIQRSRSVRVGNSIFWRDSVDWDTLKIHYYLKKGDPVADVEYCISIDEPLEISKSDDTDYLIELSGEDDWGDGVTIFVSSSKAVVKQLPYTEDELKAITSEE